MTNITTEDLVRYYNDGFIKKNDDIAFKVISDFEILIGQRMDFYTNDTEFYGVENLCKMLSLKYGNLVDSPYVDDFYSILLSYGYFLKHDIIGAIQRLGNLPNPNNNKDLIRRIISSPVIDDISFDGETFTIYSHVFGTYSFHLANQFFKDNRELLKFMSENKMTGNCHKNTEEMSKLFPEFYSITALCQFYFLGYFYHSYSLDKEENKVIDLNNNAVIDKELFDKLYMPKELMCIKNSRVSKICKNATLFENQPQKRDKIFKMALYYQLQNLSTDEAKLILK